MPDTTLPPPPTAINTPRKPKPKVNPYSPAITAALTQLNKEIIYIKSTKEIVELTPDNAEKRLSYTSVYNFKTADYSNRCVLINSLPVYLADLWMKWPQRNQANKTVYEPSHPRITAEGNLNAWFPSACIPRAGNIDLWNQFLTYTFQSDPTYRDWHTAWMAYPLQNPGAKLKTGCFFWSSQTGNGKSTLGLILRHIYGDHNSALIKENEMFARFNDHQQNKQFIFVDELKRDGSGKKSDTIKPLITQTRVSIETKYQRPYELIDCMNYYITSNHIEALHLDPEDRRFFVHDLGRTKAPRSFFTRFYKWLDNGGYEAIHHHLLHAVDLSLPIVGGDPYTLTPTPFDPDAAAPQSTARAALIEASLDDADIWLKAVMESPQNVLGDHQTLTLFRSCELYRLFREQAPEFKITLAWFGRKMAQQMFRTNEGQHLRLNDGCQDRIFSTVPNREDWLPTRIRDEYTSERA